MIYTYNEHHSVFKRNSNLIHATTWMNLDGTVLSEISQTCSHAVLCSVTSVMSDSVTYGLSHQAPLFMGFSRQKYWNGLPCPPPGDLPDPGTEAVFLTFPTSAGGFFTTSATWEALCICMYALYTKMSDFLQPSPNQLLSPQR